jgi:hypothetical protein
MKTPAGDVGWGRSGVFPLHSDDVIHRNYVLRCEDERIGIPLFFVCCCWFDTRPESPITRLMRSREGSGLDRESSRPRGRSVTGSVARLERGGTVKATTLEATIDGYFCITTQLAVVAKFAKGWASLGVGLSGRVVFGLPCHVSAVRDG